MQKEKKNEIWIGKNTQGYFIQLTDNRYVNHPQNKIMKSYTCDNLSGGDYHDILNKLLEFRELYSKGIKLKFENIPEKEKETIEKLINRLTNNAKEILATAHFFS